MEHQPNDSPSRGWTTCITVLWPFWSVRNGFITDWVSLDSIRSSQGTNFYNLYPLVWAGNLNLGGLVQDSSFRFSRTLTRQLLRGFGKWNIHRVVLLFAPCVQKINLSEKFFVSPGVVAEAIRAHFWLSGSSSTAGRHTSRIRINHPSSFKITATLLDLDP